MKTLAKNPYLAKHQFYPPKIIAEPSADLETIIVIPCFNEAELILTLESLWACERPKKAVEVIIIINAPEGSAKEIIDQNERTYGVCCQWIASREDTKLRYFSLLFNDLPKKHAGVGLARKIGMDEAVARLHTVGNNHGIIVSLDADCVVEKNYLTAIEDHFDKLPQSTACSIYFEHRLDDENSEGIIFYELFLRYYIQGLKFSAYPFACHTIGSSMAVRSNIYQQQGGMNRRKAGEDFYFLHKIMLLGGFSNIKSTTVYPSPRASGRVPFGTGKAMQDWLAGKKSHFTTYNPVLFEDLQALVRSLDDLYEGNKHKLRWPESINAFLEENDFDQKLEEIRNNSASKESFIRRFYYWLDGFRVLKYMHYGRDHFHPNIDTLIAATDLLKKMNINLDQQDAFRLLSRYRELDRIN